MAKVEEAYADLKDAEKRREQLKAELVQRGLVDSSCRFGAERLQKLLEEDNAKRAAAPATAEAPAPVGVPAPAPSPVTPPAPSPTSAPSPGVCFDAFTLYVDCVPTKGSEYSDVVWFSDLASQVLARFRQGHPEVPHYSVMDFGKGPGTWATYLEGFLLEGSLLKGIRAIVLDTRSREGQDALGTLERLASAIVKGLR